jgi:hypothetical protein
MNIHRCLKRNIILRIIDNTDTCLYADDTEISSSSHVTELTDSLIGIKQI